MKTYLAFLKGVNVGGHHKILMKDLRELLNSIGFKDVKTYIQSGNIIFKSDIESNSLLEEKILNVIKDKYNYSIDVVVKQPQDVQAILDNSPFDQSTTEKAYFILLKNSPSSQNIEQIKAIHYPDEEFFVTSIVVYLYCKKGYGRTKCNNVFFEKNLNVITTARNYKTLNKVLEISKDD